jgi:hypothetical protein
MERKKKNLNERTFFKRYRSAKEKEQEEKENHERHNDVLNKQEK